MSIAQNFHLVTDEDGNEHVVYAEMPDIPRKRFPRGTMVFWLDSVPRWVIEWQEHNGPGAYWLVDANGNSAVAGPDEISLIPWPGDLS